MMFLPQNRSTLWIYAGLFGTCSVLYRSKKRRFGKVFDEPLVGSSQDLRVVKKTIVHGQYCWWKKSCTLECSFCWGLIWIIPGQMSFSGFFQGWWNIIPFGQNQSSFENGFMEPKYRCIGLPTVPSKCLKTNSMACFLSHGGDPNPKHGKTENPGMPRGNPEHSAVGTGCLLGCPSWHGSDWINGWFQPHIYLNL